MGGKTRECGIQFGGSQENAGFRRNRTCRQVKAEVVSEEEIYVIENTGFGHWACTANTFFSGLEDDFDGSAELIQIFLNPVADSDTHRCMAVVAAGVHMARICTCPAFIKRTVTSFVSFINVNAVHVETNCQNRAGTTGFENSGDTGVILHGFDKFRRDPFI